MLTIPESYPVNAPLPKLHDAVSRLQRSIQAPFSMIASSAIAAIVGIPVDRDRSFRFVVTGDSGSS